LGLGGKPQRTRESIVFEREYITDTGKRAAKIYRHQDGVSFTDDISVRFAYGHTDAMMLPLINYKGKQVLYMADLLPSTGHLPLPYVMAYDMFPLKTLTEKKPTLNEAVEKEYILYLEHDPINECCTLQQTEKGIKGKGCF
jgi:glyoxylase-like metal-dependent hydrolase (beta-lactamase superfamily II)